MRLKEKYKKEIVPKLMVKFNYQNLMAVPKLVKAVVNVGVGKNSKEKAYIDNVVSSLSRITGQKPVLTRAKKSISAFKIKQGSIVGVKVTLRGKRMYDFVEKLINVTLPRVRDFRGLPVKQLDSQGNLIIGFREHLAFPEIKADEVDKIHGLEVCLHTNTKNGQEGQELFKLLGFPLKTD